MHLGSSFFRSISLLRSCKRAEEVDKELEMQKMEGRTQEEKDIHKAIQVQKSLDKKEYVLFFQHLFASVFSC